MKEKQDSPKSREAALEEQGAVAGLQQSSEASSEAKLQGSIQKWG